MGLNFQVDEATAAQRRFPLYLVDAGDGITAETGEAAGQPQISKNGAAFGNTSATLTAIGNGSYYVELTAGELDTIGMVTIRYKSAATAEFSLTGQVVSFDPYDAVPPVDVEQWDGSAVATPNTAGVPLVDLVRIVGGLVPTPTTTGVPDVNVERWLDTLVTLSSTTTKPEIDMFSISDDSVAANNAELDYDGTGYNKSNSEIGTVAVNTDMRGTENAALASVLGALADAASDGDPTAVDTVMQYVKQLINVLVGTAGIVTYPAALAPANGTNIAEALRAVYDDTNSLDGTKIPDTISLANINAEVDTALSDARLDEVVSATAGGIDAVVGSFLDLIMNADGAQTFAQATDSLEAAANAVAGLNDLSQAQILSDATPFPGASITEVRLAELAAANLPTDIANVQSDTDDIQTRLPAALVGGAIDADVSNIQANVIDATALDTTAVQEIARAINPQVNNALPDITFEMYDSTTHNPSTGLTVTGERSLNGGAYGAVTGSITEISDGTYQLDASAADMNGALIAFRFSEATADDTFVHVKTAA